MSMTLADAAHHVGERVHFFDPEGYGGCVLPSDGVITGTTHRYILVCYDGQTKSTETNPDALSLTTR